ncbi:ABC transporter permease [Clostridium sp. CF011]|uniref:ABC transporter permease n=1 Tax=unclassified Clostridium TaxID=2614128 RepID=UPI001C0BE866|nr:MULTISPECIES: ABC transporter permease [unclassified Clostridium]MBU3093451.1 ABC transporter permease [Clostridium sp. CF011]MBW9146168.1 ABC transporter permease [Clostridium sp. CM027]UVE39850.1 ABC transporter permease [Clostridium sp. CM027]WAG68758.1 ABC transporter permease [Clostridium sp. CF011]
MWVKKLRQRKMQSIMIFFIILICTMLMSSSIMMISSLQKPFEDLQKECQSPKVKVFPLEKGEKEIGELSKRIEGLDSVSKTVLINRHWITEKISYKGKNVETFASLTKYEGSVYGKIRSISNKVDVPKEGECFIPAALSNEYNIKVGGKIVLWSGSRNYTYKVAAIYADPYSISLAFNCEFLVSEIPEELETSKVIAVFSDKSITGNDIISEYRVKNHGVLEGRAMTIEDSMSNSAISEKILGGILLAASILVLLVSSMMIRYMIKNALIQDSKTIAIYKTIGYSSKSIMRIYMELYFFIVASGSVLGIICSSFISSKFTKQIFANIGETNHASIWFPASICFFLINGFVLLQVYLVINKLKDIKPVIVLNGRENQLGTRKTKNHPFTEKLSFSPLGIAVRNMQRDKKNTCYIILTCVISIYCVNFALSSISVLDTMKDNNYYWIGFDKFDVAAVSENQVKFDENCRVLLTDADVKRVIKTTANSNVMMKWTKGMGDPNIARMVYETYKNIDMPVVKGRNPIHSDEIVLGNLIAKEMKKDVGDYVDIYLTPDKKVSLLIVGTSQGYYELGRTCRLLSSTLEKNGVKFSFDEASIYLNKNVDKNQFIVKYNNKMKNDLKIIDRSNKYSNIMDMICGPQKEAIAPFMVLVMIIGALNLFCIVYLKNIKERKKHNIFKSIGYTGKHLLLTNLCYIGIIALVSILVTVPIFIVTFPKTMVMALSMFGFSQYLVTYNVATLVMGNTGILFVFLLSAVLSSTGLFSNHLTELGQE